MLSLNPAGEPLCSDEIIPILAALGAGSSPELAEVASGVTARPELLFDFLAPVRAVLCDAVHVHRRSIHPPNTSQSCAAGVSCLCSHCLQARVRFFYPPEASLAAEAADGIMARV